MIDTYRVPPEETPPAERDTGRGLMRTVLWVVLVVSAAANAIFSTAGPHPAVGIGFGLVTLACLAALVAHHYRHRR